MSSDFRMLILKYVQTWTQDMWPTSPTSLGFSGVIWSQLVPNISEILLHVHLEHTYHQIYVTYSTKREACEDSWVLSLFRGELTRYSILLEWLV